MSLLGGQEREDLMHDLIAWKHWTLVFFCTVSPSRNLIFLLSSAIMIFMIPLALFGIKSLTLHVALVERDN